MRRKQILNLGKALNKVEQKRILGGTSRTVCSSDFYYGGPDCPCDCYYDAVEATCFAIDFFSPSCD
ncbi:MAG: hypothetical protein ABJH82_12520 [Polaribacter sp.]|uniref:hypothetical protein n=1 Tax=Polaribacter sp. TaxID=1920175 RepID=UPI0032647E06